MRNPGNEDICHKRGGEGKEQVNLWGKIIHREMGSPMG